MDRPITTAQFDLSNGEITRIGRLYLLNRFIPLGNLAGCTRMRQLLILWVVHRFGRWLFRLAIPHEDRLTRLYRRLRPQNDPTAGPES